MADDIKSCNPSLQPIQEVIKQLSEEYFGTKHERDVSPTGLLNWFAYEPRSGVKPVFDDNFLLDITEYVEKAKEVKQKVDEATGPATSGVALDSVLMTVAVDMMGQIEMAASFRRMKAGHHFAKSKFLMRDFLGDKRHNGRSIFDRYTIHFLEDLQKAAK